MAVQGRKDAAYAAVHDGDLGGVGGHAPGKVVLTLCCGLFIAGRIEFSGHAQLGGGRDDSELFLFFQPLGGDGMRRFSAVGRQHFFYFLPGGLKGGVRGRVSHVEEEGFFAFGGVVNVGQGRLGDVFRHVEILRQVLRPEQFSVFSEGAVRHGLVVIRRASQQAAGTVEAAVPGVGSADFPQMPFSGKVGTVSRFFQEFREGGDIRIQPPAVAGASAVVVQQPYIHLVGLATGHDGGAGGGAAGSRVAPCSQHALCGEGVQMGGGDFRAVAAQVGPSHVVSQDEDDVGLVRRGGNRGEQPEGHAGQEGETWNETHGRNGVYDKAGRPADGSCPEAGKGKLSSLLARTACATGNSSGKSRVGGYGAPEKCVCYHHRTAQSRMAAP